MFATSRPDTHDASIRTNSVRIRSDMIRAAPPAKSGLSILVYILVLTLVPIAATGWFTWRHVQQIQVIGSEVELIEQSSAELAALAGLRTSLLDEATWTSALASTTELGVTTETVFATSGIDLNNRLAQARSNVDRLLSDLGLDELAFEVGLLRQDTGNAGATIQGDRYREIENALAALSQERLTELLVTAGSISGADELLASLVLLDEASTARQAAATQFTAIFEIRYWLAPSADEALKRLVKAEEQYHRALSSVERLAAADSDVGAIASQIAQSNDKIALDQATASEITHVLQQGVWHHSQPTTTHVDDIKPILIAGSNTASMSDQLVLAATKDITTAANSTQEAAKDAAWTVVAETIVVSTTTILFALAISHMIGRPLQQLALGARRIRDGKPGPDIEVCGPSEIRQAAMAINEASHNLQLTERQAAALTEGDLDNPVLSQRSTGLGTSLHAALQALAQSIADRQRYRDRLSHEATHDSLTGLTNRSATIAHLTSAMARVDRADHELGVLFIDLDGFKLVNDTHGHAAGDRALEVVAERLRGTVRQGDLVGRLGGDEFLIVAEPVDNADRACDLARRILATLETPIDIGGICVSISASIGVASTPANGRSDSDMLADADASMYEAKTQGKNRHFLHRSSIPVD